MAMIEITPQALQELIGRGVKGDGKAMQQAESILNYMLNREPDNWYFAFLMSGIYLHTERHGMAVSLLKRVLAEQPQLSEAWNNLGNAYRRENFREKSREAFLKAQELRPDDADIHSNIGTLFINEGEPEKAIEHLSKCLELDPLHKHGNWNISLAKLELEQWAEGFKQYVWGMVTNDRLVKSYNMATWWHGEQNSHIVVYDEQGVGDSALFYSVLPDVIKTQKKVVVDCHPRLYNVLRRSFPTVSVFPTRKVIDKPLEWIDEYEKEHGEIEYKAPLIAAFQYFRQDEADFPKQAYLRPNEALVEKYMEQVRECGPGPYIGITLFGGHKRTRKDLRCVDPNGQGRPLFELPATYIGLEYSPREQEYTQLEKDTGVKVHQFREACETTLNEKYEVVFNGEVIASYDNKPAAKDHRARMEGSEIVHHPGPAFDLDNLIALCVAIDRLGGAIVSVNNSTVHFCGAVGVRCHVLTPSKPAWRYGQSRNDMVFYGPWITQYRQQGEDWSPAVNKVIGVLKAQFSAKGDVANG